MFSLSVVQYKILQTIIHVSQHYMYELFRVMQEILKNLITFSKFQQKSLSLLLKLAIILSLRT